MKKYISQSANVLAFTYTVPGKVKSVNDKKEEVLIDGQVPIDVCASKGTVLNLPEDHPVIQDLVSKNILVEYTEPKQESSEKKKKEEN